MNAYDVLKDRGFVQQVTDEAGLRELFGAGPVVMYTGFDPTADSLHVGHLFPLMALLHLERLGHRPIALLGGGTAMVGDPSGKTEMRQMLGRGDIEANARSIGQQIGRILTIAEGKSRVANNADWLMGLGYIDFLRDIGRHFSVNRMLTMEAYKQRLERGLSFIEFNYQLLQAFDFLELRRRYGCRLQTGGDDQWGNIIAGVDLCRRVDQETVFGLTSPLLTTASGAKMGKTAAGAVWLDPAKVPPFQYYQYWVNCHDDDLVRLLGFFTLLPMDEVRAVSSLDGAARNAAKSVLAFEATALVHGEEAAQQAHRSAQAAFGGRSIGAEILPSSGVPRTVDAAAADVPTSTVAGSAAAAGLELTALLVQTGLASSKSEARRLISQGAVKANDTRVDDPARTITAADFAAGALMLRAGKKKVHRVVLG